MSSSSFPYKWEKISVIKNIDSIINFKDSGCDLYNVYYISKSPFHCSKVLLNCVEKLNNIPIKKELVIFSLPTVYPLNIYLDNLLIVSKKKRGERGGVPVTSIQQ